MNLCEDDLSEEAKAQFGVHTEILRTFQMATSIILDNDRLTKIGRHLFCKSVEDNYKNCKDVLNYVAQHPTSQELPPIFVLCGASRTGSTLLYNLLACDPRSRAPSLLDMICPIPPLSRSDTIAQQQRRQKREDKSNENLNNYECERNASHPSFTYEEDVLILHQGGLFVPFLEPSHSTKLADWFYDETNKDFIYEYHKIFMHMLNSVDAPQSHWILKSPHHTYNLQTLIRHYSSISLIMTHRSLHEMIPSSIRLGLAYSSVYFDSTREDAILDKQMIVNRRLQMTDIQLKRIVQFRRSHPNVSVFDVFYNDLIMNPIETVRSLYEHFKLTWSQDFEEAMLMWLRDNPQGKQGRNTYTLEEFGVTNEQIQQRYQDYNTMFNL